MVGSFINEISKFKQLIGFYTYVKLSVVLDKDLVVYMNLIVVLNKNLIKVLESTNLIVVLDKDLVAYINDF